MDMQIVADAAAHAVIAAIRGVVIAGWAVVTLIVLTPKPSR